MDVRVDLCDLLVTVPGEFEEVVRVKLRNAKPRCRMREIARRTLE